MPSRLLGRSVGHAHESAALRVAFGLAAAAAGLPECGRGGAAFCCAAAAAGAGPRVRMPEPPTCGRAVRTPAFPRQRLRARPHLEWRALMIVAHTRGGEQGGLSQ